MSQYRIEFDRWEREIKVVEIENPLNSICTFSTIRNHEFDRAMVEEEFNSCNICHAVVVQDNIIKHALWHKTLITRL